MWEVFVWVPTKGWKLVKKFMRKDHRKATAFALQFVPLEVKLVSPSGRTWQSGYCHVPLTNDDWSIVGRLDQIEQFAANPTELYS